MLESKKENYYGFDVRMYRIGDHLWISTGCQMDNI